MAITIGPSSPEKMIIDICLDCHGMNSCSILLFLQFVIVSLSGWGLLFYGGYKFFTGGKKDKNEEVFFVLLLWESKATILFHFS